MATQPPRAVVISVYGVATMRKPAAHIGGSAGVERCVDCLDQRLDRPGLGPTQKRFDLRPTLLKGVEIGRLGREPAEPRPSCRQQRSSPAALGGREIVPQPDVPRLPGRTQDLADPAGKERPLDGPVAAPRGVKPVEAQGRQHGLIGPLIMGHPLDPPLPRCRPPEAAGPGQGDSCFVDAFQAVDVEVLHGPAEGEAQRLDAFCVAL